MFFDSLCAAIIIEAEWTGLLGQGFEWGCRLRRRASVRIKTGYPTNVYRRAIAANQKTDCMHLLLTAFFIQSAFKNDVHRGMHLR